MSSVDKPKNDKRVYTKTDIDVVLINERLKTISETLQIMANNQGSTQIVIGELRDTVSEMRAYFGHLKEAKLVERLQGVEDELKDMRKKINWWSANWFKILFIGIIAGGVVFLAGEVYPYLNPSKAATEIGEIVPQKDKE
jgi:hypothetical protein